MNKLRRTKSAALEKAAEEILISKGFICIRNKKICNSDLEIDCLAYSKEMVIVIECKSLKYNISDNLERKGNMKEIKHACQQLHNRLEKIIECGFLSVNNDDTSLFHVNKSTVFLPIILTESDIYDFSALKPKDFLKDDFIFNPLVMSFDDFIFFSDLKKEKFAFFDCLYKLFEYRQISKPTSDNITNWLSIENGKRELNFDSYKTGRFRKYIFMEKLYERYFHKKTIDSGIKELLEKLKDFDFDIFCQIRTQILCFTDLDELFNKKLFTIHDCVCFFRTSLDGYFKNNIIGIVYDISTKKLAYAFSNYSLYKREINV